MYNQECVVRTSLPEVTAIPYLCMFQDSRTLTGNDTEIHTIDKDLISFYPVTAFYHDNYL